MMQYKRDRFWEHFPTMTIFLLLFPCLVLADRFTDHLEKYVAGSTSDPCQNFYSYICPDSVDYSKTFLMKTSDDFAEKLPLLFPESYFRIFASIEAAEAYDNRTNLDEGIERLIARCENSSEFHAQLENQFTKETNPEMFEECGRLARDYVIYVKDQAKRKERAESSLLLYAKTYAFYNYARNNPQVEESIRLSMEIFEIIKQYVYDQIQNSSWLKEGKELILNKVQTMKLITPNFDATDSIAQLFENFLKDFLNCRKIFKGFTNHDSMYCTSIASMNYINVIGSIERTDFFNARYTSSNKVQLWAFSYLLEGFSIQTKAVIYSLIIGHEIGHGVFVNTGHVQPKQRSCLIKNLKISCKNFIGDKKCFSGSYTYQEDAADWVGIHALLHLTEHQLLKNITQLPDSKTIFQIIAYYSCINLDAIDIGDTFNIPDIHSRSDIRTNSMLRQISKFQEEFKCKNGDPMVAHQKCFLTGKRSTKSGTTSIFAGF